MTNGPRKRGSIFAGLLLIVLGVLFLIDRFDPNFGLGHLIRLYWPVLIILWGIAKLIDHLIAHRTGEPRGALLSGGEAALIILLAFVLSGFAFRDWLREHYPDLGIDWPSFHQSYTQKRDLPPESIPSGALLDIQTERGDVVVHAADDATTLTVSATESAHAPTQSAADEIMQEVQLAIQREGNVYHIRPAQQEHGRTPVDVDLDVTVPKTVRVQVNTNRGDITVSGVTGSVMVHSGAGDVDIHDVTSDVNADLQKGDAKFENVAGNLKVTGHGNDIDVGQIGGDANIEGAFVGSIHANNVSKNLRYLSPWSDLSIAHLTGTLEADASNVGISDATGPAKLNTHNKDIDISNVAGRIEIVNTHGDVKVSYARPPREDLNVTNDTGDTDVTLPASSTFQVSAVSRSGEAESEFEDASLKASNENDRGQISGKVGSSGPTITIATSYGTIHLHKST